MLIFPAIDLYDGKAVRLYKGDYNQMTVYSDTPETLAVYFYNKGASAIHIVDLEGAKSGSTPNISVVEKIVNAAPLFSEIGGGIRNMETVENYLSIGVDRVILGTAAVKDPEFLNKAADRYGEKIAVGVDIRDGFVSIHGWTESSELDAFAFCKKLQSIGIGTIICTDISKDGAMSGTNHTLYKELSEMLSINITASGGVSSIDDVKKLRALDIYGAIIGKAYYTGAIDLTEAVEVAK